MTLTVGRVDLRHGEVLETLRAIPDASFDAVLSDVPYGFGNKEPTAQEIADYVLGKSSLDTGGDFMNAKWTVPSVAEWKEMFRVLKPGAPVLAFAGPRTQDLIGIGMRAAGFEIADCLSWEFSQGMPKPATTTDKFIDWSLDVERDVVGTQMLTGNAAVSTKDKGGTYGIQVGTVPPKAIDVTAATSPEAKRWEGYGHALAPAHEPIILAYRPFDGTIAANVLKHDVGGLNVAACRVGTMGGTRKVPDRSGGMSKDNGITMGNGLDGGVKSEITAGRWPKNVILSHDDRCVRVGVRRVRANGSITGPAASAKRKNVVLGLDPTARGAFVAYGDGDGSGVMQSWDCVSTCPIRIMDEQSGDRKSTLAGRADPAGRHGNPGDNGGASQFGGGNSAVYADQGGASRTFYQPKVSRAERELGCEHLPLKSPGECTDREEDSPGLGPQAGAGRSGGARNYGPCLKPIALTKYLATMLLPPARANGTRRLLVPFCGTGSEVIGAVRAGWDEVVGIERDAGFVAIARARVARWHQIPAEMDEGDAVRSAEKPDDRQASLFGVAQ